MNVAPTAANGELCTLVLRHHTLACFGLACLPPARDINNIPFYFCECGRLLLMKPSLSAARRVVARASPLCFR